MLGSVSEAEDMVQEALLRAHQAFDAGEQIASPRAYVATVTTPLAINELHSARVRRERYFGEWLDHLHHRHSHRRRERVERVRRQAGPSASAPPPAVPRVNAMTFDAARLAARSVARHRRGRSVRVGAPPGPRRTLGRRP